MNSLEQCLEQFKDYTDGIRVLFLLFRGKDGGDNSDEEARCFSTRVSLNTNEFKKNLKELWFLQEHLYPECRIYLSVNARNLKKTIRTLKMDLLDSDYQDDLGKQRVQERIVKSSRHILMQPKNATTSLFIIDIDNNNIEEEMTEVCRHTTILSTYKTKNGWHIITEPFNPGLYKGSGDIKKDGLALLKY